MKQYFYLAKKFLLIPVIVLLFISFTGVFKIYQTGTVKKDGSAVFNLTYSGNYSVVEKNKFSLGNFAFGEDNVKKYFTSPNSEVKKVKISKSDKDSLFYVETEIEIKDINKLGSIFGFSDFASSY